MNVSELYDLTFWIEENIINTDIPSHYQSLSSILQQHANPNAQKQPFEDQKNSLVSVLKDVPLEHLSKDQIDFLSCLGIANAVGEEGVNKIEDILFKNVIDVATSSSKINEIINHINVGIQKSQQIKEGLADCALEESYETNSEVLMRVSFAGHAKMEHLTDFKKWGSTWYDIGRGVSMVHNASPEDIKVVGATKGSIIIELAVVAKIAGTVGGIILGGLKIAEKVLDIKKKAEELKGLKIDNKIIKDIEKDANAKKKEEIKQITLNIAGDLNLSDAEGDKTTALESAVKKLVDFIEKGGTVDFITPDDEDSNEDTQKANNELRLKFEEIRKLEKKMFLLENKSTKP